MHMERVFSGLWEVVSSIPTPARCDVYTLNYFPIGIASKRASCNRETAFNCCFFSRKHLAVGRRLTALYKCVLFLNSAQRWVAPYINPNQRRKHVRFRVFFSVWFIWTIKCNFNGSAILLEYLERYRVVIWMFKYKTCLKLSNYCQSVIIGTNLK